MRNNTHTGILVKTAEGEFSSPPADLQRLSSETGPWRLFATAGQAVAIAKVVSPCMDLDSENRSFRATCPWGRPGYAMAADRSREVSSPDHTGARTSLVLSA